MNEKLAVIGNHKSQILLGVVTFGAGLGLGYLLGTRSKEPTYQVIPAREQPEEFVDSAELANPSIDTSETNAVKAFIAEKLKERSWHEGAEVVVTVEGEDNVEIRNVFAHSDSEWDYDVELAKRSPNAPYIIHKDEFYESNNDYTQSTLTYYSGDDILVDEDSSPIYNHHDVVGELLFGHGSQDPNVVHIRHDKRKVEFEVIRDAGQYSVEVLGLEIENNDRVKNLRHTAIPKFRDD